MIKSRSIHVAAASVVVVFFFLLSTMAIPAAADVVEHTFVVSQMNRTRLCKETLVTVVNGQLPGPMIEDRKEPCGGMHMTSASGHPCMAPSSSDRGTVQGEWWEQELAQLDTNMRDGFFADNPSASTVNGKLGDLYNCSGNQLHPVSVAQDGYVLDVEPGKTYLLRILNAALLYEYYHKFTVVASDPNYVNPYTTDILAISPGETVDALGNLTSMDHRLRPTVPTGVDERLFFVLGVGKTSCQRAQSCTSRKGGDWNILVATMNNISFELHSEMTSLLETHYYNIIDMDVLRELPDRPPRASNYTDRSLIPEGPKEAQLEQTSKATVARWLRCGTTVEVVFQSTALLQTDAHPMHLHGYDMFLAAQGLGSMTLRRTLRDTTW
ncbi:hypothetical protein HU200_029321 [Digitaria exilis]|uniref:Laccase n=1 Tax=Digitaria exilis TaxID=1010633 RepID=A0A835ES35_9POAL|nr:hypothetical protein HU200_029321 [Digitaria exilis]